MSGDEKLSYSEKFQRKAKEELEAKEKRRKLTPTPYPESEPPRQRRTPKSTFDDTKILEEIKKLYEKMESMDKLKPTQSEKKSNAEIYKILKDSKDHYAQRLYQALFGSKGTRKSANDNFAQNRFDLALEFLRENNLI